MPVIEPVVLQSEKISLRHIGPQGQLWPGVSSPIASFAPVLSQTLYARWLPWLDLADSPDVVGGSYTTRLNDAGDFQIAVPNATASDGFLWRSRFDPTGHLQWVEVYYEGELEGVFCIDTVNPTDSAGYSSTVDATDLCSSIWGNGAGIQSGTGGQLQTVVFDVGTLLTSLFDAQAWQDFSDAAFPSLLQGLLNSALGLRLSPWQHMAVSDPSSGGTVTVHGQDGAFLLKKAYERDITVVQSPRDVIERATEVWVPVVADDFPSGSYLQGTQLITQNATWGTTTAYGGTVAPGQAGVVLSVPSSATGTGSQAAGPAFATTGGPAGPPDWHNATPGVLHPNDGQYAYATQPVSTAAQTSQSLIINAFGFGIPAGATVVGVTVQILHGKRGVGAVSDSVVSLRNAGGILGGNKAFAGWTFPLVYDTYGGAADVWGASLTPSIVNDPNFGITLTVNLPTTGTDPVTAQVDYVQMTINYTVASPSTQAGIQLQDTVASTRTWRAECAVATNTLTGLDNGGIQVTESSGDTYSLFFFGNGIAVFEVDGVQLASVITTVATTYTLMLESDGEWVSAFLNGQLVLCARRASTSATTTLQLLVQLNGVAGAAATMTVSSALMEFSQAFLQRGTDKGDYVLPGTAATYPSGGLHARYSNNADLQSDANALAKIHTPTRMQSYGGSAPAEYVNQQDATINHPNSATGFAPTPGADPNTNYSVIWFGAIYLKLGTLAGSYSFRFTVDDGVRIWIGKTKWGDQIIDSWIAQGATDYTAAIACGSGSSLAGRDSRGNLVGRDGWYPIKIEYFQSAGSCAAVFQFTPPQGYTDPGGTALTGGAQRVVPATSFSPLGCVDQRYQGISHFDLAQQTQQAFGYQMAVAPKQLESGLFPGVLAPRIREGQDTDAVLEPDKGARQDALLLFGPRQALAWPLPGSLVKSRWRPGDGLRVQNQDVNIWDTQPRQILTFTRNFVPSGTASAQVSLAERPRTPARTLKQSLLGLTRSQRTYQKQLTTLTGAYVAGVSVANGAQGDTSGVMLQPSDTIVRAYVRCAWQAAAFGLVVNQADQTSTLGGPWTVQPLTVDISPVATTFSGLHGLGLYVNAINKSGGINTVPDIQLFVDVLR